MIAHRKNPIPYRLGSVAVRGFFWCLVALCMLVIAGCAPQWSRLNNSGLDAMKEGRYTEAEGRLQKALEHAEREFASNDIRLAKILMNLATVYDQLGRHREAEPLHLRGLRIREEWLGVEHRDVARSLNNLGLCYSEQGKEAEAEASFSRAIAIHETAQEREDSVLLNPKHDLFGVQLEKNKKWIGMNLVVLTPLGNLRRLYLKQDRYQAAEHVLQIEDDYARRFWGHGNFVSWSLRREQYRFYYDKDMYSEAEPHARRTLYAAEDILGLDHPSVAAILCDLASIHGHLGKPDDAEKEYREALQIYEKAGESSRSNLANCLLLLGGLYADEGRYADAEGALKRSIEIWEETDGPSSWGVFAVLEDLALASRRQQKLVEAEGYLLRRLSIAEKAYGEEERELLPILKEYSDLLVEMGREADAEKVASRAESIRRKNPAQEPEE